MLPVPKALERLDDASPEALVGPDKPIPEPLQFLGKLPVLGLPGVPFIRVTTEVVEKEDSDAVVVATGSVPYIPDIPGVDGDNVVEVRQVLKGEVEVGNNVVIIGGDDDIQSLSTADFLAELGKKVEVLGSNYQCGTKIEPCTRAAIFQRLFQKGVVLAPLTRVKEISGDTVVAYNVFNRQERRIEGVDTIVIAHGGREDNALYYTLKDKVKEIYIVGDANGIRRVHNATMDGAVVGRIL